VHHGLPAPGTAKKADIDGLAQTQHACEFAIDKVDFDASVQADLVGTDEVAVDEVDVAPFDVFKAVATEQCAFDCQWCVARFALANFRVLEIGKSLAAVPDA
jgi:hypothetical protein